MSALPTGVAVSSTEIEDGNFLDAVPFVLLEEPLVRSAEIAELCCELARSAKLDTELSKLLTSYPFSKYLQLYSTE